MKEKNIVMLCCVATLCQAQPREISTIHVRFPLQKEAHVDINVDIKETEDHNKFHPVDHEEDFDEHFFEDELVAVTDVQVAHHERSETFMQRAQELLEVVGMHAVLGALYVSEVCSDSYKLLTEYITSFTDKE